MTKDLLSNAVYGGIPAKKIKDIEVYKRKVLKEGVSSKAMSATEKKQFLLKKFKN